MKKKLLFFICLTLCYLGSNYAQVETVQSFVDFDDKSLFVIETADSDDCSQTIVFETGSGVTADSWFNNSTEFIEALAPNSQLIAYNRNGYPPSANTTEERSLINLANDLNEIIEAKSINEQVILVGHSFGGPIIRQYAILYPERVEGLVFIDVSHEDLPEFANFTQAGEDILVAFAQTLIDVFPGLFYEAQQALEYVQDGAALPNLPDVDILTLTSLQPQAGETQEDLDAIFAAHASLGEGVTNFVHIGTEDAGHFIHEDQPALVSDNMISQFDLETCVLSIDDQLLPGSLQIYPNPTADYFSVTTTASSLPQVDYTIDIYDLSGKRIQEFKGFNIADNRQFDVSDLPTGIFIVTVRSEASTVNFKLIRE